MSDPIKPFICYKAGLKMSIQPRTAAGWRAFAGWMAIMAALTGGFVWLMQGRHGAGAAAALVAGYTLAMVCWGVGMARWMYVRSEVVDMAELLELKRQRDAEAKRGRR